MIKLLVRWSAGLGIAGTLFLSAGIAENLTALALPEAEILKKLDPVPVFTIADEQGAPLVASGEDEAKVAGVFISQEDANQFVSQLKTKNPELADKVKVVPVSLGEVYKLAESAKTEENALNFAYVPQEEAVTSAKTIGEANQQPYQGGVPLFVAKGGEDKGYLTIEKDSQQVIPFFFDKKQLEQVVTKFKEQKPEIADSVDIEVVPLEGVIQTLETSEDKMLEKIVLIPTEESIKFLQNVSAPEEATPEPAAPEK
ncbi:Tic22 family protein [Waterburya agarophytonicola]|uniref:Tic22 family protein n=1 Tax=Waterburya agarophytonicola TaxID=2886916 RepID=UPI001E33E7C2|nr:Tic22 family protein [Waterburya agarophytonicola]